MAYNIGPILADCLHKRQLSACRCKMVPIVGQYWLADIGPILGQQLSVHWAITYFTLLTKKCVEKSGYRKKIYFF